MLEIEGLLAEMAELKVGAPLACDEADDDWNDFTETTDPVVPHSTTLAQKIPEKTSEMSNSVNSGTSSEDLSFMDSFLDKAKSGSLEDLVQSFDKKLSECFGDYQDKENVSQIAPVQVRSQEEVINGCQLVFSQSSCKHKKSSIKHSMFFLLW